MISERIARSPLYRLFMNNTAGTKCVEQLMNDDGSTGNVILQFSCSVLFNNRDTEFYIRILHPGSRTSPETIQIVIQPSRAESLVNNLPTCLFLFIYYFLTIKPTRCTNFSNLFFK